MTNRPEKNFTYWFGSLLLLQAIVLVYLSFFSADFKTFGWTVTESDNLQEISLASGENSNAGLEENQHYNQPLPYWISVAGNSLFPDSRFGYRLFHILLYLSGLAGFFLLVKKYLDARTAFYSCCILVASLFFSWHMQLSNPQGLFTIFLISALSGFFLHLKSYQKSFFWLIYISIALAILSAGIKGLIFPVLILFIFLMFRIKMNGQTLEKVDFGKGILFSLLICLPWLLYAGWNWDAQLLYESFISHPLKGYRAGFFGWEGAFYVPFLFIILSILPFGFFLPGAFGYCWKLRQKKPLLLLSALGLLIILVIYAFPDLFYPHNLMPALPFAAILVGYQLSCISGRPLSKMKLYTGVGGTALLALGLPAGLYFLIAETVNQTQLSLLFYLLLIILPLGTISSFFLWQKKKTDEGMMVLTISYLVFNLLLVQLAPSIKALQALLLMFTA